MIASEKAPRVRTSGYLPSLDGWRAIAILAVIVFHDGLYRWGPWNDRWIHDQGFLGVDLFFCISGLLICSRLLDEEHRNGRISLKKFYLRRTLRILPPMLAYLLAISFLAARGLIKVGIAPWVTSLLFVRNYYEAFTLNSTGSIYTNHFWSLSVEEHFYLIVPAVLVFRRAWRIKLFTSLTCVFIVWNIVHTLLFRHDPSQNYANARSDLRFQELLFPVLVAILLRNWFWRQRLLRYCRPTVLIVISLIVMGVGFRVSHGVTCNVALPIVFTLLVVGTVLHPDTWLGRLLELAPMRGLGRISYSIYLWQQLFFTGEQRSTNRVLAHLQEHPWNFILVLIAALVSYYLIERPAIQLAHRLAPPSTPGHPDLAASSSAGSARR